ncbi:uncharacterized protein L203_104469 [Cryptococcus depauperatus CBS 7841]|uniref:DNA ligase IV n=1 Tax=Cryptococcus depauperatus CBS 7841 TaxID=1295531 RepID=A0AAJ8M351_9TREE
MFHHYNHFCATQDGKDGKLAPSAVFQRPEGCSNPNSTPAFSLVCAMMERLKKENSFKRFEILERHFALWRAKVGSDLYPFIRLLLPDRDRERPVYRLKESTIAKCYVEVLGLEKNGSSAIRLVKWKQPTNDLSEYPGGDFAKVCYHEIAARSTVERGTLTVQDVNELLDRLANTRLKQSELITIMRNMNQHCTASEQEWIIRIILKGLHMGVRERTVLSAFHTDAIALFNVCSDLRRVCWTLHRPDIRLNENETTLQLFHPFSPQLCYRNSNSSHGAIAKLVGAPNEFCMEEKLDGQRLHLHVWSSPWSQKYHFGWRDDDTSADENSARPCFVIFDILFLNDRCLTRTRLSERKRLLRSGRIFKNIELFAGRLELINEVIGKSKDDITTFLNRVLESREEGLVVKRMNSVYQMNFRGQDWVKVKPEYSDQMGENLELLVIGGWWGRGGRYGKISRLLCGLRVEENVFIGRPNFETFCVVGSGMRYSDYEWILNAHSQHWKIFDKNNPPPWLKSGPVGVDDKPDVYIEPENSFVIRIKASEVVQAVGGYGVGFTLRFPRCIHIFRDTRHEDHLLDHNEQERDMWNCMSVEQFQRARSGSEIERRKRCIDSHGSSPKRKQKPVNSEKRQLISSFQSQQLSQRNVSDDLFNGLLFYVAKGSSERSKAELEALVHTHGGKFIQAQTANLSALVVSPDEKSPLVRAQIKKGVSVIKPEWLLECVKRKKILPLIKSLLVSASEDDAASRYYNKPLDERSTSRYLKTLKENLTARVAKMCRRITKIKGNLRLNDPNDIVEYMSDLDSHYGCGMHRYMEDKEEDNDSCGSDIQEGCSRSRLFPVHGVDIKLEDAMGEDLQATNYNENKIFCHLVFYIDYSENAKANGLQISFPPSDTILRLSKAEHLLKMHGGRIIADIYDPKLTHIIMDNNDSGRYVEILRKTAKPKRKHIITPCWVEECVNEETLVNEDAHHTK